MNREPVDPKSFLFVSFLCNITHEIKRKRKKYLLLSLTNCYQVNLKYSEIIKFPEFDKRNDSREM